MKGNTMQLKDNKVVIEFFCPKSLADGLEQLAKAQYSSRSAVLRQLIAQAVASRQQAAVTTTAGTARA
jgi:predicted transcriptional regulator